MPNKDSELRKHGTVIRSRSFSELGIDLARYIPQGKKREEILKQVNAYLDTFTKALRSKFREPQYARTDSFAPICDVLAAYDGVAECFVTSRRIKRAPIQIGINLSGAARMGSPTYAARIAAVMAVIELCKLRGQTTDITVVYGRYMAYDRKTSPIRDGLHHHRINVSKHMTQDTLLSLGDMNLREHYFTYATKHNLLSCGYHIHAVERAGVKEFDFCLDRIEENHDIELQKIWRALERFRDN